MSQHYGDNPYAAPRPESLTPSQERSGALLTHVGVGAATVLSAGTLGFLAALAVYLMYGDRGPFLRHNAANAMNIQLNGLMWAAIIGVVGVFTLGLLWFAFAVIPVVMVVLHVLAALKASAGEWWNPPMTLRFIK
ncbi:DUF4870 domain-containing protein [Nocardioides montaniterrae]